MNCRQFTRSVAAAMAVPLATQQPYHWCGAKRLIGIQGWGGVTYGHGIAGRQVPGQGAGGIILSRKYSDMKLVNLRGAGDAVRELGLA